MNEFDLVAPYLMLETEELCHSCARMQELLRWVAADDLPGTDLRELVRKIFLVKSLYASRVAGEENE